MMPPAQTKKSTPAAVAAGIKASERWGDQGDRRAKGSDEEHPAHAQAVLEDVCHSSQGRATACDDVPRVTAELATRVGRATVAAATTRAAEGAGEHAQEPGRGEERREEAGQSAEEQCCVDAVRKLNDQVNAPGRELQQREANRQEPDRRPDRLGAEAGIARDDPEGQGRGGHELDVQEGLQRDHAPIMPVAPCLTQSPVWQLTATLHCLLRVAALSIVASSSEA